MWVGQELAVGEGWELMQQNLTQVFFDICCSLPKREQIFTEHFGFYKHQNRSFQTITLSYNFKMEFSYLGTDDIFKSSLTNTDLIEHYFKVN